MFEKVAGEASRMRGDSTTAATIPASPTGQDSAACSRYVLDVLKPTNRIRAQARRGRRQPTLAEAAMWTLLRDRRFSGIKFRRQTPIGPYIADFCCPALKLIVELDGGVHVLRAEADAVRDAWLAQAGFTVLRFGNEAVLRNPAVVFDAVRKAARLPSPLEGEGGRRSRPDEG